MTTDIRLALGIVLTLDVLAIVACLCWLASDIQKERDRTKYGRRGL